MRRFYSKGPEASRPSKSEFDTYSVRKNEGLECDSYLSHVIDNYDALPKYVGFTQGELSDEHKWIRPDWGPGMFKNMLGEAERTQSALQHERASLASAFCELEAVRAERPQRDPPTLDLAAQQA